MGFFKEKAQGCEWWGWGGSKGGVSLLFFWAVASGFQDVSPDSGLGKGWVCFQVQEGWSDH